MRRVVHLLELDEEAAFAKLAGRYVDTGRVRDSLVASSADSIRRVSAHGLEFGTSVYYARFLTEHVGPVTPKGGLKRPLPVAVLKLTESTRQQVAHDVMEYAAQPSVEGML